MDLLVFLKYDELVCWDKVELFNIQSLPSEDYTVITIF